jgi:phospholipid transport system transporter-binding protein
LTAASEAATFESHAGGHSRVCGPLDFATVTHLLPLGTSAIEQGNAAVIDLGGVTGSDSSGLALLVEWLSIAKAAGHPVRYENMPLQLQQLARLSDVEELLVAPPSIAA